MRLLLAILGVLSLALLACDARPQPVPEYQGVPPPPAYHLPPSTDEMIFLAEVIVVATFASASAGIETVPGDPGVAATYLPKQTLNFTAIEYLKGTGPANFEVKVVDPGPVYDEGDLYEGYLTAAAAQAESDKLLAERNTTWDDRPGVLFLQQSPRSANRSNRDFRSTAQGVYGFTYANAGVYSDFAYAIDTPSRTWFPAREAPPSSAKSADNGTSNRTPAANSEFITDGAETPPPVTTLLALKTRIAEIDALIAAGDGSARYKECVRSSIVRERFFRNWKGPFPPEEKSLRSGLAKGTVMVESVLLRYDEYLIRTTSGEDADLFAYSTVDDDMDPSNGHFIREVTLRPLPMGEYSVNFHIGLPLHTLCGFNTNHNNYYSVNVTVAPPTGTLHEALFDPVTVGTVVRADANNGKLEPRAFTIGSTSTELTSLEYNNGSVVLTLTPHVSLGDNILHFIELDGTVSLSLAADEATVDSTLGTYSWPVASEPWEDGDQLMLRIRRPPGVAVKLSPRVDPLDIRTDITVEWVDSQDCNDEYFVAIYNDESLSLITRMLGRHPAPETDTVTSDTGELWDLFPTGPYYGYWAGVTCTTGWRLVGKASLASGLPNNAATGVPTISGTAQAGETLSASTSAISDADGLTGVTYSYQWLADDTAITGATSSSYTLTSEEVGDAIKVRVTFTDDRGNSESLTSSFTSTKNHAC